MSGLPKFARYESDRSDCAGPCSTCDCAPREPAAPGHSWKARLITLLALLATAVVYLAGCGGGGPEEDDAPPDVPVPRVDCAARPELCR